MRRLLARRRRTRCVAQAAAAGASRHCGHRPVPGGPRRCDFDDLRPHPGHGGPVRRQQLLIARREGCSQNEKASDPCGHRPSLSRLRRGPRRPSDSGGLRRPQSSPCDGLSRGDRSSQQIATLHLRSQGGAIGPSVVMIRRRARRSPRPTRAAGSGGTSAPDPQISTPPVTPQATGRNSNLKATSMP